MKSWSKEEAEMQGTEKSKRSPTRLAIITAFLGFIGAADSILVGFYLLSTVSSISNIQDQGLQSWTISVVVAIALLALIYGSYLILKGHTQKGATINMTGGIILALVYIYYSTFSQPRLLDWLSPAGIILTIPAILSGAIGLIRGTKD
jgi:Na+(H+)/acetate symporter ActP